MDWQQLFDSFEFENDRRIHYNVQPVATIQFDTLVNHGQWILPFKL